MLRFFALLNIFYKQCSIVKLEQFAGVYRGEFWYIILRKSFDQSYVI